MRTFRASDGSPTARFPPTTADEARIDWSPDGRLLAFNGGRFTEGCAHLCFIRSIYVVGANGRGLRLLAEFAADPAWSPRGGTIAFTISAWVALVPARGEPIRRLERGAQPVWSPDGRALAHVSPPPAFRVVVRTLASRKPRPIAAGGWPRWSPTGAWIAYVVNGGLRLVSADGRRRRVVLPAEGFRRFSGPPAWLRGGRIVFGLFPE